MRELIRLVIILSILSFIILLGVTSCSRDSQVVVDNTVKHQKVDVILLVAPWCHNCREELPVAESNLPNPEKVYVSAVLETGVSPNKKATDTDCEEMKKSSGATFDFLPDEKLFGLYREYIGGNSIALPAAILTADDDICENGVCKIDHSLIKTYQAPYDIKLVLKYAESLVK